MIQTTSYAIIAIVFEEEQEKYIGYLEASGGVGMLLGPIVGSVLYEFLDFSYTFFLIGVVFIALTPVFFMITPSSVNAQDSIRSSLSSRGSISKAAGNHYEALIEEQKAEGEDEAEGEVDENKDDEDLETDNRRKSLGAKNGEGSGIEGSGTSKVLTEGSSGLIEESKVFVPKKRKPIQYSDLL